MNTLFKFVERITLTSKLVTGFSVGILIALAIGINSLSSIASMEAGMEKMYDNDLRGVTAVKDANINLIYIGRAMRHMLIAQDDTTRDTALANIKRSRENLMTHLVEARKRIYRPEVIARYDQVQVDLTKAFEAFEQAVGMIQREKSNPSAAAQFITSKEFAAIIAKADGGLDELSDIKEKAAGAALEIARAEAGQNKHVAIILLVFGVVVASLVGFVIGLSIQRPNERLRNSVEELAAGKVDTPIPHTNYTNEIGVMARAIAVLQGIYRSANEQHWVKSQVSEISSALQQAEDTTALVQLAVSRIAPVIGAGHAALYVADSDRHFTLLGSYGFRERKHLNNSFAVGEGLVGQAAMEKKPITLTAPQNYIQINSGLGEGPPACIAVLPIMHQDRVLAVLEVASFQKFTEREVALLDALIPALAVSLEIMDRNQRTKVLLAATQEQAERMEKQAAQMEEQTVEMEAQQAELLETENWFRSIIETAPDGMLVVDATGRILLANPQSGLLLGFAPGELVGSEFAQRMPSLALAGEGGFITKGVAAVRKDGSSLALDASCSVLPDRGGRGRCVSIALRVHVTAGAAST